MSIICFANVLVSSVCRVSSYLKIVVMNPEGIRSGYECVLNVCVCVFVECVRQVFAGASKKQHCPAILN